ncbi:MAG TPA: TonB family protein [Candidatus Syntrophosphaera sp.]|nr:TonB family protein [Candidatus Syntrophosphaera sp.]HPK83527.1 TonB family protein [Candidatus Syntrophosphaera sp.]HRT59846.1 TonB family protein [Candidatus Syntrophosphaera sp.]
MAAKIIDWKDHANAQFSKALALAITLILFGFLVMPRMESQQSKEETALAEMAEAPPDQREKEEDVQAQEIEISIPVFSEELATEDTPELAEQRAHALQIFGDYQATTSPTLQQADEDEMPPGFEPYEDAPVPISSINPAYPAFAKKAGVQGTVVLEVEVYKDGRVGNVEVRKSVQSGTGGLDEAAIAAVKAARFQPGKMNGNPVNTLVILDVEFKLN